MKTQPTQQYIWSIFLTATLIHALAVFDTAAARGAAMLPDLNTNLSEINENASKTATNNGRMTLCQEVRIVTGKPLESTIKDPLKRQIIKQAKKNLADRISVEVDKIKLLEVREVTWPDSSLGCPQPGMFYTQVPQDGFLIRLAAGGRMYFYHSGSTPDPFLCAETSQIVPHLNKDDEFVPPPESEID